MTPGPIDRSTAAGSAEEQRVLRAYREAVRVLDESPAQQARDAILAAAARASGARPHPVGQRPRWRLPLAAAASLLAGTIALLLAIEVDRRPSSEVQPETAAPPPPPAGPSGATIVSHSDEAQPAGRVAAPAARPTAPAPKALAPSRAAAGRQTAAGGAKDEARPLAAPAVPALPPPSPAASTGGGAGAGVAMPAVPPQRTLRAEGAAVAPSARAADAGPGSATQPQTPWRSSPETWIERIVGLREQGRHAEADEELAALRARHPGLRLPPAVLPPAQR